MTDRVLIANRGEIAVRILRACREVGMEVVMIYTPTDKHLEYLRYADEVMCVSSYLAANDIIMSALQTRSNLIHPGYGFLAENADFSAACESNDLTFVGPSSALIARLGNKLEARQTVSEKLPVIPGSDSLSTTEEALKAAETLSFPLVLKAVHGGGGRGIRRVEDCPTIEQVFELAQMEAERAFGNGELFLEECVDAARHIEIQVLGDGLGNAVQLGSRDCSIQVNHQKLIEEAPAPGEPVGLEDLANRCAELSASLHYAGALTFEFLYSESQFHFLEVNTRLQVEHGVTELVTGIDIVKAQLEIALNHGLPVHQDEIRVTGHAVECRLGMKPSESQQVSLLRLPSGPGIRVDSYITEGTMVPYQYDPLMAKLIAWDVDRLSAMRRMARALSEVQVEEVGTNLDSLKSHIHQLCEQSR